MTKKMIGIFKKTLPRVMSFSPIFSGTNTDCSVLFSAYCEEYRHMLYSFYKFGAIDYQDWNDSLNIFSYITTHNFDYSYLDFCKILKSDSFYISLLSSYQEGSLHD